MIAFSLVLLHFGTTAVVLSGWGLLVLLVILLVGLA